MQMHRVWSRFWELAGRVPIRQKMIGIVVTSLLILGLSIAWWVHNGLGGWLSYLLSEERVAQAMNVGTRGVIIITILAALLGLVVAWLLTWVLTRPILHIARIAQQVGEDNLDVRAPVWANDEIGQLGSAFNKMVSNLAQSQQELKESNQQLRRRNRELTTLYELARLTVEAPVQDTLAFGLASVLEVTHSETGFVSLFDDTLRPERIHATEDIRALVGRNGPAVQALYRQVYEAGAVQTEHAPLAIAASCLMIPVRIKDKVGGALIVFSNDDEALSTQNEQFLTAIGTQLGLAVENDQLLEELKRKEDIRSRLLAKIVGAQEDERKRISRELHDGSGQALTSMLVQLKVLERLPSAEDMRSAAQDLRRLTSQTLEDIRRLAQNLRPAALDDLGLLSALESHTKEYARQTGLHIDFNAPSEWVRLPHNYEITLYRFVQEALTNTVKHAQAEQASIYLEQHNGTVSVSIDDDGAGFDVEQVLASADRGLGLRGMAERIELIGGTFSLESSPGTGTQISAQVPLA